MYVFLRDQRYRPPFVSMQEIARKEIGILVTISTSFHYLEQIPTYVVLSLDFPNFSQFVLNNANLCKS
jgi:hypothetical protein